MANAKQSAATQILTRIAFLEIFFISELLQQHASTQCQPVKAAPNPSKSRATVYPSPSYLADTLRV
jgi:hypothetical protein